MLKTTGWRCRRRRFCSDSGTQSSPDASRDRCDRDPRGSPTAVTPHRGFTDGRSTPRYPRLEYRLEVLTKTGVRGAVHGRAQLPRPRVQRLQADRAVGHGPHGRPGNRLQRSDGSELHRVRFDDGSELQVRSGDGAQLPVRSDDGSELSDLRSDDGSELPVHESDGSELSALYRSERSELHAGLRPVERSVLRVRSDRDDVPPV